MSDRRFLPSNYTDDPERLLRNRARDPPPHQLPPPHLITPIHRQPGITPHPRSPKTQIVNAFFSKLLGPRPGLPFDTPHPPGRYIESPRSQQKPIMAQLPDDKGKATEQGGSGGSNLNRDGTATAMVDPSKDEQIDFLQREVARLQLELGNRTASRRDSGVSHNSQESHAPLAPGQPHEVGSQHSTHHSTQPIASGPQAADGTHSQPIPPSATQFAEAGRYPNYPAPANPWYQAPYGAQQMFHPPFTPFHPPNGEQSAQQPGQPPPQFQYPPMTYPMGFNPWQQTQQPPYQPHPHYQAPYLMNPPQLWGDPHQPYPPAPTHMTPGYTTTYVAPPAQPVQAQEPEQAIMTADKIRLADAPKFSGKFGNPDDLFHWQGLVEEFLDVKRLADDRERFKLLGSLLLDVQLSAWFRSCKSDLEGRSWAEVMNLIALGTLPEGWVADREELIRTLKIREREGLDAYFARAQALHRPVKSQGRISDRNLAEYLTWGGPKAWSSHIRREKLLQVTDFSFVHFQSEARAIWRVLIDTGVLREGQYNSAPAAANNSSTGTTSAPNQQNPTAVLTPEEKADNIWRYRQYMKLMGLCPNCKKACGDPNCTIKSKKFISVPPPHLFNPGPRPANMFEQAPPGAPTQKPAGRPPIPSGQTSTRVAAVGERPDISDEEVERYERADAVRIAMIEEEAEENGIGSRSDERALGQTDSHT